MTESFQQLMRTITQAITQELAGRPVSAELQPWLNTHYGADSDWFKQTTDACQQGVAEGWMCNREHGGIKFGRVAKPDEALSHFSVDVVDMADIAGPHHTHPNGEIDLVMPLTPGALFDGQPAGWKVYPPGSAHCPTVSQGRALVLYLLPQGAIEFTKA